MSQHNSLVFQVAQIARHLSGWWGKDAGHTSSKIVGDNLKGEIAVFSFTISSGGEEIKGAPLVFIPHLVDKVVQLLDGNER